MQHGVQHAKNVRMLYKTILQLHKNLPEALQSLGNSYVTDEFKRHKKCNPAETAQFMMEWTHYAVSLANQLGLKEEKSTLDIGSNINEKTLEFMREDQIGQLYELLKAARENKR